MSFLIAEPDVVAAAAGSLANVRSALSDAAAAAATPTTGLVAAAGDEVSAAISQLFGAYGQQFQALNAEANAFHAEFVRLLNGGAVAYAAAEAASASPMQAVLDAVNAPTQSLLGRPLIGNGADGAAGTGSNPGGNGQPGGILYGNGGTGWPGRAQRRRRR
ncbi:PE family protein [Mycobacterium szulgai]|nr:PE family protein [Mycobacterium szulgai]